MTSKNNCATLKEELTDAQIKFLEYCKELGFGMIDTVIVKDGEPVMAKQSEKNIKFTDY